MNKTNKLIFATACVVFMAVVFSTTSCKRRVDKDYDFNVSMPEDIYMGYAEEDTISIPMKLVFEGYNMDEVQFLFNFTQGSNKGELYLNNEKLKEAKAYDLDTAEVVFKFIGKNAGQYQLKFEIINDKGKRIFKEIYVNYKLGEYGYKIEPVEFPDTNDIWQGIEYNYKLKLTPIQFKDRSYKIKFSSFNGEISLNGDSVEKETFYEIKDINDINIGLTKKDSSANNELIYHIVSYRNIQVTDTIVHKFKRNRITSSIGLGVSHSGGGVFGDYENNGRITITQEGGVKKIEVKNSKPFGSDILQRLVIDNIPIKITVVKTPVITQKSELKIVDYGVEIYNTSTNKREWYSQRDVTVKNIVFKEGNHFMTVDISQIPELSLANIQIKAKVFFTVVDEFGNKHENLFIIQRTK